LDWDVNTGYRTPAVWIGTSARPHHYTPPSKKPQPQKKGTNTAHAHRKHIETSTSPDAETGAEREQTSPHQEGRRRAGPFAVVPLQQRPNFLTERKHRVRATLHARGPRHIRRRTPPLTCAGATPRPPPSSRIEPVLKIPPRRRAKMLHAQALNQRRTAAEDRIQFVASPCHRQLLSSRRIKVVARAVADVVPHQEVPTMLKQPAAIRCKPSRPPLLLPQAPSSDVVPHRTGHCNNASRCGPLQVANTIIRRRPPTTN
jgi:hypothetical protein